MYARGQNEILVFMKMTGFPHSTVCVYQCTIIHHHITLYICTYCVYHVLLVSLVYGRVYKAAAPCPQCKRRKIHIEWNQCSTYLHRTMMFILMRCVRRCDDDNAAMTMMFYLMTVIDEPSLQKMQFQIFHIYAFICLSYCTAAAARRGSGFRKKPTHSILNGKCFLCRISFSM